MHRYMSDIDERGYPRGGTVLAWIEPGASVLLKLRHRVWLPNEIVVPLPEPK